MRFGLIFLAACTPFTTISMSSEARPPQQVGSELGKLEQRECFAQERGAGLGSMGTRGGTVKSQRKPSYGAGSSTSSAPSAPAPMEQTVAAVRGHSPPPAQSSVSEGVSESDDAREAPLVKQESGDLAPRPAGKHLDWGATVYLSNDDSMSLASAQRVMAALEQGFGLAADHIRPHELLNYFSFTTGRVPQGSLFSVQSAAVQEGSTLTMGFAVQGASPKRAPLDLTLVVDRSGSMSAQDRMGYTRRGLSLMSDQFVDGDRIDLVLFDHEVCTPLKNYVVGRDDPSLFKETLNKMQPRGSTDLDSGLREAYAIQEGRSDARGRNQRVMVLTDALLNTGNVNVDLVSEVGRAYEKNGIRLTGVGVGSGFNDKMLDRLTEKGKGAYVFLGSEAVVDRVFGPGFPSLVQTIAHDVRFSLDLPKSLAMERFYGEEVSTDPEDVQPIHYYAGTSQFFLQDLAMKGLKNSDPVKLTIEWEDVTTGKSHEQDYTYTVGQLKGAPSRNVRKAQALMAWSDLLFEVALNGSCGESVGIFNTARSLLTDAELDQATRLLSKHCDGLDTPVRVAESKSSEVSFSVTIDADTPITEVALTCDDLTHRQGVSACDMVAKFEFGESPGECVLELRGGVPVSQVVQVPEVDTRLRCRLRAGQFFCNG